MLKKLFVSAVAGCAWSLCALAQNTAVVPPSVAGVSSPNGNSIPLGNFSSGTYQVMYSTDQLAAIPAGSHITGMQLRMYNPATTDFPAAALNVAKYDVRLATSALTPATMSTNFATNMVNPVLVRSGVLSLAANAYPSGASGGTPEGWGPVIGFTTTYQYLGGPLVVEIRADSSSNTGQHYAEVVTVAGKIANGRTSSSASTDASSSSGDGIVVRLTFTPPPNDLAQGVTKVFLAEEYAGATTGGGLSTMTALTARTYVSVASADQFDTIGPNSDFVGLSTRLTSTQSSWPSVATVFSKYDIQLSRSQNVPGSLSNTVANNVGADAVMVRSGGLFVGVNALVGPDVAPCPFGFPIPFANAYHYRGGPLLSVIRHDGHVGTSAFLESVLATDPLYNVRVQSRSDTSSSSSATATNVASYTMGRYDVDAGTSSPLGQAMPLASGGTLEWAEVMQTVIAASELRHIPVGSVIDSLWLRQAIGAGSGPASDVSSADFEVYLSSAARRPASMSLTVAENEGADRVLVHDGAIVIPANTMPAASNGNFGKIVQFQKNFVYKGGDLCVTTKHSGLSGTLGVPEAVPGTTTTNRSIYSFTPNSATGFFYGAGFTGTAMKLGYIPSVTAPNYLATTEGTDGVNFFVTNYTAQMIIAASQLRAVDVGSAITGMSFRLSSSGGGGAFPTADTTLPRFDVTMAPAANGPLAASNTFASNMGPGAVAVRSGSMFVPWHAMPASGNAGIASEQAWYVPFTRAFIYGGGDLCVLIRTEGSLPGASYVDVDNLSPTVRGVGKLANGDADALVANATNGGIVLRLAFTARAFCPWDLNNDGMVDDADFSLFVVAYNMLECDDPSMPQGCPSDFNYDRIVEDADFSLFVVAYNNLLCP